MSAPARTMVRGEAAIEKDSTPVRAAGLRAAGRLAACPMVMVRALGSAAVRMRGGAPKTWAMSAARSLAASWMGPGSAAERTMAVWASSVSWACAGMKAARPTSARSQNGRWRRQGFMVAELPWRFGLTIQELALTKEDGVEQSAATRAIAGCGRIPLPCFSK
jgi:hypothetical protein